MDVDVQRLKSSVDAEREYLKTIAIVDFENAKRLIESVNNAILARVTVEEIEKILGHMTTIRRLKL